MDIAQEAIETGLSSRLPPAVRHHNRLLASERNKRKAGRRRREARGLQGPPKPPGASRFPGSKTLQAATTGLRFRGLACATSRLKGSHPQMGARTLQQTLCEAENLGASFACVWISGIPSKQKSMYIVSIWPTGVAGGRAVPPDVREEPLRL